MDSALLTGTAAVLLFAGLTGCGHDKNPGNVQTTPVGSTAPGTGGAAAGPLSAKDRECKDEIVRQLTDPSQQTADTPPECSGVSDARIGDLAEIAGKEIAAKASPRPSGDTS